MHQGRQKKLFYTIEEAVRKKENLPEPVQQKQSAQIQIIERRRKRKHGYGKNSAGNAARVKKR